MTARRLVAVPLLAALAASAGSAISDETTAQLVLRVGTLHAGDGTTIANALVVVDDGKFLVVGAGDPPPRSKVREFPSAHAAPGFVDGVTRFALQGGAAEDVQVLTPHIRASDAFDPKSPALRGLLAMGTTVVGIAPAPSNVAAGRAGAVRLGASGARVIESAGPPVFSFTASALRWDRVPATLAGARRLLERAFAGERWREPGEVDVPVLPEALAALRGLEGGPALAWCDSLVSATAAAETLRAKGLAPSLVGCRECAGDPDTLAALGAPCVVTGLRPEDPLAVLALPGRLAGKGVSVTITTGAPERSPRSLRLALSLAVAAGMPAEAALSSVTSAPAKALGLAGRIGRVAPKLDADLVVFDGAPWEVRSRVLLVVSGGEVAWEAATESKR